MKKYGEKKCENYIVDERGIIDILYKKILIVNDLFMYLLN